MSSALESAEAIRIDGVVQGVGLRPTVYRLARRFDLRGTVRNVGSAVQITVAGPKERIDDFVGALVHEAPGLARIDRLQRQPCPMPSVEVFSIESSAEGPAFLELASDVAICEACLAETRDPTNRRHGHPFANCTACGPRLSIVRDLPYDRPRTSMEAFAMCPACRREYEDPADRRFHAQPIACPACGPRLRGRPGSADPMQQAIDALRSGCIVAIKGVGGYHLACDATNEAAVARLRERKHRPAKPFALMARDLAMVERHARPTAEERGLLASRAAPIVLLRADGPIALAPSIAPRQRTLGFMLPYTALHHLLMAQMAAPLVLTSGNCVDEPQCTGDDEAVDRLGDIADCFLWHDREIVHRVDDSVVRVAAGATRVLRLGRGLAPMSLHLPPGFDAAPDVLALGGEVKNTLCLLHGGKAVLSQHLGDLGQPRANAAHESAVALYGGLFAHRAQAIAIDRHPDYRAAQLGRERARADGLALVAVQHHHAHVAACLAEHESPLDAPPVLGIALDGLGYGDDGTWWGGEFLQADYRGATRLASFAPVLMPGGMQAIREPWRMAWAFLRRDRSIADLAREHEALPFFRLLKERPLAQLESMAIAGINSPLTSSCGRLFDAVAALLGVCTEALYEGQPAIELEACVDPDALRGEQPYAFGLDETTIFTTPLWPAMLRDLARGDPRGSIAARFHVGLAHAIAAMVERLTQRYADPWQHRVALGGGVFQNAVLLELLTQRLEAAGFQVWSPAQVPANDGGLALGQAVVAAARLIHDEEVNACASASRPR
jgi:hydrogenase maturation protein HypF